MQPEPPLTVYAAPPPIPRGAAPIYRVHPMNAFVPYPQQPFPPYPRQTIPPQPVVTHQAIQPPVIPQPKQPAVATTKSFRRAVSNFTPTDDGTLRHLVEMHGTNWPLIQKTMSQFSETQLRDRWKAITESSNAAVPVDPTVRSKISITHPQPQVHIPPQRPGVVTTVTKKLATVFMDIPENISPQPNTSCDWAFRALKNDPKLAHIENMAQLTEAAAIADWRHERMMAAMDAGEIVTVWRRPKW